MRHLLSGYNRGMRTTASILLALFCLPAIGGELDVMVARSINSIRASHGLVRLDPSPHLQKAAESQSLWMASVGRMDHLREPAKSFDEFLSCDYHPSNRAVKAGYFRFDQLFRVDRNPTGATVVPLPAANDQVGEIIARGVGGDEAYNYKTVVAGWMNSPGHRKEILKTPYREFGVHVCSPRRGETYWCVVFGYK